MEMVKGKLIPNDHKNDEAAAHADSESSDVDGSVRLLPE
jgi:hypothetical protein